MNAPLTETDGQAGAELPPPRVDHADASGGLAPIRPVTALWAIVIRSFAFVRKEVVEIVRQPRLIGLLVVGPFALLVMFGLGYGEDSLVKRAVFVGPADSIYADVLTNYEEQLDDFIDSRGLVPDVGEARRMLVDGEVDVVVVFPEDPHVSVLAGERAVIDILHTEIDPIQVGAVEVAARLAIQEVNATVLAALATEAQAGLQSASAFGDRFSELAAAAAADPVGTRDAVRDELQHLGPALDGTSVVLSRLEGADPELIAALEETRRSAAELNARVEAVDESTSDEDLDAFATALTALADQIDGTVVLDPDVLVRPFESRTDNLAGDSITPTDYFTPASLALLLQHLALTFAAMSLVRDRRTGLFELMRVGPLSSIEIIVGKIFAYLLVGSFVGAALIAAAVFILGVSLAGSVGWLAIMVVGVLLSSLSLGMVLAIVSQTESQAVQFAMLALLAGLFFSGFALPIESLAYPVRFVSWLLPVTHGISSMQDIMLRGTAPDDPTVIGLAALVVGYGTLAVLALRRQLRTGGDG
ncbi:MAG TPA: ABC transporter permease [Ilumatobacter sp.]|nr:ABC transporter permease [Ilumatobacter sp.]